MLYKLKQHIFLYNRMNFTEEQIRQQMNNCFISHSSNGHLDLVEMLMNKAGVDVNARDDMTDETALMGASQGGHVNIVLYLCLLYTSPSPRDS